jgi:hypothetical protein
VRNGRVLVVVLSAAALLLIVPFLIVWLLTRGGDEVLKVGDCVKQSGSNAVAVSCSETGAFKIESRVDSRDQCPSREQPVAVLTGSNGKQQFLCLTPASGG